MEGLSPSVPPLYQQQGQRWGQRQSRTLPQHGMSPGGRGSRRPWDLFALPAQVTTDLGPSMSALCVQPLPDKRQTLLGQVPAMTSMSSWLLLFSPSLPSEKCYFLPKFPTLSPHFSPTIMMFLTAQFSAWHLGCLPSRTCLQIWSLLSCLLALLL